MEQPERKDQVLVAIPWYRPEQWRRLKEISSDAKSMEESYEQWNAFANRRVNELKRLGRRVEKVPVDVEELLKWCQGRNRPVDAQARAEFAAAKCAEAHRGEQ